jgi:hypothetical protein
VKVGIGPAVHRPENQTEERTMKVAVFVKATRSSEAGTLPSEQLLADMGKYNEALVNAGIMKSGEGLNAAKADLLRRAGRNAEATSAYEISLSPARQEPEIRFLQRRLHSLWSTSE